MAGFRRQRTSAVKASQESAPSPTPRDAHPSADPDTQLMLLAAGGDRNAADQLVDRNRARIAGFITHLVHDRRIVEDLTQDVFYAALRNADKYRPTAKVSTWLYRIATNTTLNYLKQRATRSRAAALPEGAQEPADRREPGPEQHVAQDELRGQVSRAIRTLPLNQRIALTLCEYESCSYEQIATVLDTTVESVRSLLRRARLALRLELKELE